MVYLSVRLSICPSIGQSINPSVTLLRIVMKIGGFQQMKPSISCNHVIIQSFRQHEDASLASLALLKGAPPHYDMYQGTSIIKIRASLACKEYFLEVISIDFRSNEWQQKIRQQEVRHEKHKKPQQQQSIASSGLTYDQRMKVNY